MNFVPTPSSLSTVISPPRLMHHLVHVSQTQAKTLHVVAVAGRDAIEFLKNLLQVVAAYADAIVLDCDFEPLVGQVMRRHHQIERTLLAAIFHSIVEQVEYHVGKVHLVHIDQRIHGIGSQQ